MSTLPSKNSQVLTENINKSTSNPSTTTGPKNLVGKDAYDRINFLYQAAVQVLATQPCNVELARYYIKSLCDIKEKKVLKWSCDMRHSICDGCYMLLIPGITGYVRNAKNGSNVMECLSCKKKKRTNNVGLHCKRKRKKKTKKSKVEVESSADSHHTK